MYKRQTAMLVLAVALFLSGCGPQVTKISGTVTFDGTALKDIGVLLQPVSGEMETPEPAFGITNEQGRFELVRILSKKKGLIPGEYAVVITWCDPAPKPEHEPQNPCPYDIPQSAGDGSKRVVIEKQSGQVLDFELSDFIADP